VIEELKAEQQIVHPHQIATAKSRQEGFEVQDEGTMTLTVSASDYTSVGTAIHRESKARATRKEKQSGVR
jgi:hypothetical protein